VAVDAAQRPDAAEGAHEDEHEACGLKQEVQHGAVLPRGIREDQHEDDE